MTLRNVTAVTLNERREIVDDAAIEIDGNRFYQLGKPQTILRGNELDCNGLVAIPGLIEPTRTPTNLS